MADVQAPSNSLYDKVRALNVRRNQDWARFGASVPAAFSAAMQGADPAAAARQFYPTPEKRPSQLQVAAAKKDLVDAMLHEQDKRRDARAGIIEKMAAQDKLLEEIVKGAVDAYGSFNSANVTGGKARMEQRTALIGEMNKAMADAAEAARPNDPSAVEGAFNALQNLITPEGIRDSAFTAALNNQLQKLDRGGQDALMYRLEMDIAAKDGHAPEGEGMQMGSMSHILNAFPGDTNAQQALAIYQRVGDNVSAIQQRAINDRWATSLAELDNQMRIGGSNPAKVAEFIKVIKDAVGEQDPEKRVELAGKLADLVDPAAAAGEKPDAGRYADILDSMDSETAPANLQEARRRLIEDPEFQAWMKQNGFQDSGLALKELRRMLRQRAHEARQSDLATMRERRLADVGPGTGKRSAAAEATSVGTAAPAPAQNGPTWTTDKDGNVYEMSGNKLIPADDNSAAQLMALLEEAPDKADEFMLTGQYDRLKGEMALEPQTEGVPGVGAPPEPAKDGEEKPLTIENQRKGMTVPMMQEQMRYHTGQLLTHPGAELQDIARFARERIKRAKEKKALAQAGEAAAMTANEPGYR